MRRFSPTWYLEASSSSQVGKYFDPPIPPANDARTVSWHNDDQQVAKLGVSCKDRSLLADLGVFFQVVIFAAKIHLATVATRAGQAELAEFHLKVVRLGLGRCFA